MFNDDEETTAERASFDDGHCSGGDRARQGSVVITLWTAWLSCLRHVTHS